MARVLREWLAVGCVCGAAVLALALGGFTERGDALIYDQLARLHRRAPSQRVLIVAIDDASLAALGPWPWPRALHARLIDRLREGGAAGIADDALFVEPDPGGGDAALAAAMKREGHVVLPVLTSAPGENGRAVAVTPPVPILAGAAATLGHVNLPIDSDGVARRFSVAEAAYGACRPHLALALAATAGAGGPKADCAALAAASRRVNGLLAAPPRLIPFAGPPGAFPALPAVEVLNGAAPKSLIAGRLVLIGAAAAGLGDRHITAVSGRAGPMAGVEVQANILDAALRGAVLSAPPRWLLALLSLAPTAVFMGALMVLRPSANMLAGAGLFAAVFAVSAGAFFCGLWLAPLSAAAGLLLAYPLWSWRRLSAASAYLSHEIARFDAAPAAPRLAAPSDVLARQVDALARAADHLRALSRQVRGALQSLPDAALLIDGEGKIALANSHAARLSGAASPDELGGRALRDWLARALGEAEGAYVADALARGEGSVEATSRWGRDYEVSQAAMTMEDGPAGVILRLADVTAIRRAMRQREEALQLLTHDIRAPIASIATLAGGRRSDQEGEAALGKIDAYAKRALTLAESYVQFARAESYRFDPVVFDLGQAALDAADELWPQADGKGVRIVASGGEDGVLVRGDPSLMARALINLLDNAVKHSPPGGRIAVAVFAEGGEAVCTVSDEGPGVSPTDAEALFEAFNRGEALGRGGSGAGLGLAIVHAAVKRHGGRVRALPRTGGATFEVRLPLAHEEPEA